MLKIIKKIIPVLLLAVALFSACKKEQYFFDTGVLTPNYNGTILEYLKAKPAYFDTLVRVIKIAGMEDVFQKENITFFAPPSSSIYKSLRRLNIHLRSQGRDTVSKLEQIKPAIWKETLSMYIFQGSNRLKDYPQLDTLALLAYPGQAYFSYAKRTMNIGVIHNDAGGIKYAGYRQLYLSFIPDFSKPLERLVNIPVASSDVAPTNGIVHVLRFQKHNFGFDTDRFINTVVTEGILPAN